MSVFFNDIFMLMDENDNDNCCLISQDVLQDKHVTLECGHKFNYKNIFNEIVKQKTVTNSCEIQKLTSKQIKCPYCRNVQNRLIPHFEGYERIKGVNFPLKHCMFTHKCDYIFKKGKNKGNKCLKPCNEEFCKKHISKNILFCAKQNDLCDNKLNK